MKQYTIVTGAAGFIGRNIVQELNQRGNDHLLLVDVLGNEEKWRNLVGLRFEEIFSPDEFLALVKSDQAPKAQTLIHLGACSATTERDADYLLKNNTHYTRSLCEWSLRHGTRFVYASSAATYGAGEYGYDDADTNTTRLVPLNMYGYSKHLFDLWALKSGLFAKIAGLKYFNVYGPHEDHKADMRSVIHKAYYQIQTEGVVRLFKSYRPDYGDGEQKRDFVYVRDAVNITLFLADHPEVGGLFNCGTGLARTWKELVLALFAAMGREPKIEYIEMPEGLREKYQYYTQAEMGKFQKLSGYEVPFTSLEEGINDYVSSYLVKR